MPLSASTNLVLIPSGSPSGTVTISWSFPGEEIKLEESLTKVGSPTSFQRRPIPDTQLVSGSYTQTLTPGDVYEVRAFPRNISFAGMGEAEKARWSIGNVVVHALQLPTNLQTDFNERVGGTFYRYTIATTGTSTHAIMEIGTAPSVAGPAGFRTMPSPMMTVTSFDPATTVHNLTTDKLDLLPEDRAQLADARFALIRVSDATGGWEQIERTFKTLDRKPTIDFKKVDAQSLGEPPSETEGEMEFKLEAWALDGQDWRVVQAFQFSNNNVTLQPFDVINFVLEPVVVIGPRPVRDMVAGLDECCVVCKVKRGPSESSPSKGASDGPIRAYPTVGSLGRGCDHFVLPSGRHLLPAQP